MKNVRVPLDEQNTCQLPPKCVCCGSARELRKTEETLQASTPLQLVSVLPWIVVGPALKTAPGGFFLALILSILLYAAFSIKVLVSVPRCEECLARRRAKGRNAAVLFFLGLLIIILSTLLIHEAILPLGFVVTFAAIFYAAIAARRSSVRLARLHGSDAVLLLPIDTTQE